jgi:hypothetical protein
VLSGPFLVRAWLSAMSFTFVLGAISIALARGAANGIWDAGFAINLALSIAFGLVVGWTGRWVELVEGVVYGAIVVLAGTDLVEASRHTTTVDIVLADLAVFTVALVGVAALVLGGTVVGWLARLIRTRCRFACLVTRTA